MFSSITVLVPMPALTASVLRKSFIRYAGLVLQAVQVIVNNKPVRQMRSFLIKVRCVRNDR